MRCEVLACKHNDDGYCLDASYVRITADGECDSMLVFEEDGEDDG